MPSFRTGVVDDIIHERRGLQRIAVAMGEGEPERAFVLTALTGSVSVGDRVVVNTTAVELGLGTGGWHVVHWNLERDDWTEDGGGHIIKLRYTSLQADVGAAEEHHPDLPPSLDGTPVVACSVHSQVAVVAAAARWKRAGTRIVYVMTDGAALPLALSDLMAALVERDLIAGTITAGHAFGGDLEAVTVPSALSLARHVLDAELIIVGMGPGVVGTGSSLGTTAIEVAPILDAAAALGARPVLCPRWSDADERHRHRGLSHHTTTALTMARSPVEVPLVAGERSHAEVDQRHHQVEVDVPDVAEVLAGLDLSVSTMGRGPADDPGFFSHAGAAGVLAAKMLGDGQSHANEHR